MSQQQVVDYFATRPEGVLKFTQGALSKKLSKKGELQARADQNPSALSGKRARVVTRPDVEEALWLWVQKMEKKNEIVTGPMLMEKRKRFEELLHVPEVERLNGTGWITSFKQTYKMKERRRFGEAGSVDIRVVERDRIAKRRILARFDKRDQFNVDETSFFPSAPPERGLSTKQMKGKKKNKFRITVAVCCNADGSEKDKLIYIGKSKRPRCFGKKDPKNMRPALYYRANKKAWMTKELFEEWLRKFDEKMRRQKRHVCLLLDNFSGHDVEYKPKNVECHFFEPNITSYVQPCDAGIIWCLKAHYRTLLYRRALELEEQGEADIYDIDLLTAMRLLHEAWNEGVSAETIRNCWRHTGISPDDSDDWEDVDNSDVEMVEDDSESTLHEAWRVLMAYATSDWSRSQAEDELKAVLQDEFNPVDWQGPLNAVMECEDTESAVEAVNSLMPEFTKTSSHDNPSSPSHAIRAVCADLKKAEEDFMACVQELHDRKRIKGDMPPIEDLLDPPEEREDADSEETDHWSEGDKGLKEIAGYVEQRWDATGQLRLADVDEDEEQEEEPYKINYSKALEAARLLGEVCTNRGDFDNSFDLGKYL
ncbi:DDE-domain-containing protein [Dendrothele bispora CBS 962.96]|uniref:DDE-domain-containing protein n=1 Tax=Dendrothele bispora (strain CBS 962.96) TaxID=1314807 RepID=A0A4S8LW78_DENBC|nr:DDE-domain-containing protein [Dendrothele bispora CBS 962.96]